MDEPARQQAVVTALVTEHFVQAGARAATITESNGRAAIYLSAVSSGLVAFGFLAQGAGRLDPLVAAVLPALFILGIFTFVRLVQTSIEAAACRSSGSAATIGPWSPRPNSSSASSAAPAWPCWPARSPLLDRRASWPSAWSAR
jgi:hypothetical protein